jgi:hypothetical protein
VSLLPPGLNLALTIRIPSSINQIIQMYPDPIEQAKMLGLFGM